MAFSVSDRVRKKCLEYDVHLAADAQFGHEGAKSIAIEGPATISAGLFDFDLLAGFSYMGDLQPAQGSFVRHANLIGRFCSIAGGVAMGAPEHPTHWISSHTIFYGARRDWRLSRDFQSRNARQTERAVQHYVAGIADAHPKVQIGNDVWIGEGAFIRRGVSIGDGAIIASHAVVTRDVPPYAIVGGVPAKIIRYRFAPDVVEALLGLQWWHFGVSALEGVDWTDVDMALWQITRNIESGRAEPYAAPILSVSADEVDVLLADAAT